MNFLSVLYAKAGITVDGVTTLNNTATALTPATNDNSTKIATTAFVKNQNYYPYPTGTTAQYVRGDGSLATFTQTGGGGSSVSYYLNGSVSQGTIGGNAYYEMSKIAVIGTAADFNLNADGYIAQFVTDAGDPALLNIPGGNWNFEMFFSTSSSGGTPSFYVELYKYDGTTLTLISSGSTNPESITNGTATDLYLTSLAVPTTTLTLTDRLAIRVYVTHSGRTITLHTQNGHLCQVITTFTTGLTALNGLTAQVQNFAVGADGSDFNISSVIDTHTFNLPTASATKRGALSSIDWSSFDAKVDFGDLSATSPLSYNGSGVFSIAQSSTSTNGYLSSTDWNTFNNKIGGSGTANYIAKFTSGSVVGNSIIYDNGTNVGIGTVNPNSNGGASATVVHIHGVNSGDWAVTHYTNNNTGAAADDGTVVGVIGSGGDMYIFNYENSSIILGTNSNERMRIAASGNVLIGTTSGSFPLTVVGKIGANIFSDSYLEFSSSGHVILKANNDVFVGYSQNFVVKQNGYVGVGTATPLYRLESTTTALFGTTAYGVLNIAGDNPAYIKIKTNIPFSYGSQGYTVNIKGFQYGSAQTLDLQICWHQYIDLFTSPTITSKGSFAPVVRLARESGLVVIVLTWGQYWPKLYVESVHNYLNDGYANGWTWVDENVTGDKTVTLSYKNDFGDDFVKTAAGLVGIGTNNPSYKLDVFGNTRIKSTSYGGLIVETNDVTTIKLVSNSGSTKNWGFATTNLAVNDFGIYQSTSANGDPINAGSPILYFSGTGAATFSSSVTAKGDLLIWGGNAAQSGFITGNSAGGGLYIAASGTNQNIRLVPSGTGFVQVIGALDVSSSVTAVGALFTSSTETRGTIRTTFTGDNSYYSLFSNDGALTLDTYGVGGSIYLKILGSTKLIIAASGNLLLGTVTDAGYKLDVNGTARVVGALTSSVPSGTGTFKITNTSVAKTWSIYPLTNGAETDINFYEESTTVTALTLKSGGAATFSNRIDATGATFTGAGSSILLVRSTSTSGYATTDYYNSSNAQVASFGYGNASVPASAVQNAAYIYTAAGIDFVGYMGGAERLRIASTGAATFASSVTASSLIKSGGTSSQYLMADGSTSTLTNPITGTGTTNYLPKFTASSTIGNSIIREVGGVAVSITGNVSVNGDWSTTYPIYQMIDTRVGGAEWNIENGRTIGNLEFYNGAAGGTKLTITPSGSVGIGTTSPTTKLTISDTSAITNHIDIVGYGVNAKGHIGQFYGNLYLSSNYFYNGTQNADDSSYGQAAIVLSAGTTNTSYIDFNLSDAGASNPSSKVRITSNGNVLIGTTTDAGYKLDVNGYGRFSGGVLLEANSTGVPLFYAKQTGSSGYTAIQFSGNNGTDIASFTTYNGDIFIGSWNGGNGSIGQLRINTTTGAATFSSSITTTNGYISVNYNAGDVITWGGIAPYANVYGALSWDVDKAIVKGRGGYALGLYVDNNVSKGITIATTGAATFSSSVTATNFIVPGGTSAQFLKADGSLDSNVYLTATSSTFSYTASVTLSPTWQNTGVSSTNLGTGAYLVTCNANDFGVGGGQYDCTYTGLMYFFAGTTNGSDANEIVLHHTGHADNGRYIYLRTLSTLNADGKTYLQISGNGTNSAASNYQLTFKKLL